MTHVLMFDFDTLQYANDLKAAGVPEKQAEVQSHKLAETIKEQNQSINNLIDNSLATKHDIELVKKDIKELETQLELKIEQVRVELKRDIKELENKLIIKLGALLGSIMLGGIALLQYLK